MMSRVVLSNEAILIVNDDEDISSLFADALEASWFRTSKSNNASIALDRIKSKPNEFALVLIDSTSQSGDFAKEAKNINPHIKVSSITFI